MTLALIILSIVLTIALSLSVYLNVKLTRQMFVLEEQVEKSLDMLDTSYQTITSISTHPVLSDEPIIKEVMHNIKVAAQAVHLVANNLVVFSQNETTEEDNDESGNADN